MNISKQQIKKILLMMRVTFALQDKYPGEFSFPKTDKVKSRIPKMVLTKKVKIIPSVYLEYLMSNPIKSPMLITLSDHTTGKLTCLQQGEK